MDVADEQEIAALEKRMQDFQRSCGWRLLMNEHVAVHRGADSIYVCLLYTSMLHIAQGTLVAFILLTILFYLRTERSYLYLVLNVLSYTCLLYTS